MMFSLYDIRWFIEMAKVIAPEIGNAFGAKTWEEVFYNPYHATFINNKLYHLMARGLLSLQDLSTINYIIMSGSFHNWQHFWRAWKQRLIRGDYLICPVCLTMNHYSVRRCRYCGFNIYEYFYNPRFQPLKVYIPKRVAYTPQAQQYIQQPQMKKQIKAEYTVKKKEDIVKDLKTLLSFSRRISIKMVASVFGVSEKDILRILIELKKRSGEEFPFIVEDNFIVRVEGATSENVEKTIDDLIKEFERKKER